MALPIKPTPKLNVKSSEEFLKKVRSELGKPAQFVSTPKLTSAKRKIKSYARRGTE